jgi:hypothetical protein
MLVSTSVEMVTPLLYDGVCDHLKGQCPGIGTEMVSRISLDTILAIRPRCHLRSKVYHGHMNRPVYSEPLPRLILNIFRETTLVDIFCIPSSMSLLCRCYLKSPSGSQARAVKSPLYLMIDMNSAGQIPKCPSKRRTPSKNWKGW